MKRAIAALALLAAVSATGWAQKPVTETASVEATATIEAIDHTGRIVTLKGKDGNEVDVYAGPEVKRFDELKVGDTVTFRYYESVAMHIRKPGQAAAPTSEGAEKVARGTGAKPSATVSKQETATVTIKAIDSKVPAVTVATENGHTASFKVADKKNLEGVAVGDRVEITYTTAFMVSVK